eukprot:4392990-Alexandrium_andersonii.AAC.1
MSRTSDLTFQSILWVAVAGPATTPLIRLLCLLQLQALDTMRYRFLPRLQPMLWALCHGVALLLLLVLVLLVAVAGGDVAVALATAA